MRFYADFNIHSKYSRGTDPDMEIPTIVDWARRKGLALLGTGDFTHPQWRVELKKFLKPSSGRGVYEYGGVRFLLTSEMMCDTVKGGRSFKINHLVFAPNFTMVDRLADALSPYGDLETEACPSLRLSARELVKKVREVSVDFLVVPAHAWGPHHSLFSPQFGYDGLLEAYGDQAPHVRVLETGLSCDPALLGRWSPMDSCVLISNSDAHHPSHLGREANIFDCPLDYKDIVSALVNGDGKRFLGTVETYSELDRFFGTGHRSCRTRGNGGPCPACGKPFAEGVAARLEALSDRPAGDGADGKPFVKTLPLQDILADVLGFQPEADSVRKIYHDTVPRQGTEMEILLDWPEERLKRSLPPAVAEGVLAVRRGEVECEAGYDGLSGRARVRCSGPAAADAAQLSLF